MPKRSSKRPRDTNELARRIVDIATGAKVTDKLWEIGDVVKVLEDWEATNLRRPL
jgi:hypothetical protein